MFVDVAGSLRPREIPNLENEDQQILKIIG